MSLSLARVTRYMSTTASEAAITILLDADVDLSVPSCPP